MARPLLILLALFCLLFLLPTSSFALPQSEINAIYDIRAAFGARTLWSNASIDSLCQSSATAHLDSLTIQCSSVGTSDAHIIGIEHDYSLSPVYAAYPQSLKNLTELVLFRFSPNSGSMTDLSVLASMKSLASIQISTYIPNMAFLDLSQLTKLSSANFFMPNSRSLPLIANSPEMFWLTIEMAAGTVGDAVVIPDGMLQGMSSLTYLQLRTSPSGLRTLPDFSEHVLLETLDLRENNLTYSSLASIDFSVFKSLMYLYVTGNDHLEKLPSSMSELTSLMSLEAAECSLNRPDSFFDMTKTQITAIRADDNGFSSMPTAFCQMSSRLPSLGNLSINLSENPLSSLPDCFLQYSIEEIYLSATSFTTFPTGLFNSPIKYIGWYFNDRPMTLPGGVWNLAKWYPVLVELALDSLQLQAPFPVALKGAPNLKHVYCEVNRFTGTLPDDFFIGSKIETLWIGGNSLSGPFPSSVGSLTGLKQLGVAFNKFTSIPNSIGQVTELEYLDFTDNDLQSIPSNSVWQKLNNLLELHVGGNTRLAGTLPPAWFSVDRLYNLNASSCSFRGDVPPVNSSQLYSIHISDNMLDGTIKEPIRIGNLVHFFVDRNLLHGSIPESFGNTTADLKWNSLRSFNVSFNRLTGTIPENFNRLSRLTSLALSNNGLSGALPDFSLLSRMQTFQADNNFFNICQSDPQFLAAGHLESCSVKSNLFPGACHCESFVEDVCEADLECPSPDYIPTPVPLGEAPTPIRPPPYAAPFDEPTPVDEASETPRTIPTGAAPSLSTLPLSKLLALVAVLALLL